MIQLAECDFSNAPKHTIINSLKIQTQWKSSASTDSWHGEHTSTVVKSLRLINDLTMDKDRRKKIRPLEIGRFNRQSVWPDYWSGHEKM